MINVSWRSLLAVKIDSLRLLSRVGILTILLSCLFLTIIFFSHLKNLPFAL